MCGRGAEIEVEGILFLIPRIHQAIVLGQTFKTNHKIVTTSKAGATILC